MDEDYLKEVLNAIKKQFELDFASYAVSKLERELEEFDQTNTVEGGLVDKVAQAKPHVKAQLQTLVANNRVDIRDVDEGGNPRRNLLNYINTLLKEEPPKQIDNQYLDRRFNINLGKGKRGRSDDVRYFLDFVRQYNHAVYHFQRTEKILQRRKPLESAVEEAKGNEFYSADHKPVFSRRSMENSADFLKYSVDDIVKRFPDQLNGKEKTVITTLIVSARLAKIDVFRDDRHYAELFRALSPQ